MPGATVTDSRSVVKMNGPTTSTSDTTMPLAAIHSLPFDVEDATMHLGYNPVEKIAGVPTGAASETVFMEITGDDTHWAHAVRYISKHLDYGGGEDDEAELHPQAATKTRSLRVAQSVAEGAGPWQQADEFFIFGGKGKGRIGGRRGNKKHTKAKDERRAPIPKMGLGWHSLAFEPRSSDIKPEEEQNSAEEEAQEGKDHEPSAKKQRVCKADDEATPMLSKIPVTIVRQRIGRPVACERGFSGVDFFQSMVLFCRRSKATDALQKAVQKVEAEKAKSRQQEQELSGSDQKEKRPSCCSASFALLYLCKLMTDDVEEKKENQVSLWRFDTRMRCWMALPRRWARSLESVVVEEKTKKQLLNDLEWFELEDTRVFYKEHGIPYHRCYLFYGPPGAGKTSLIYALAGHLERNLAFLQVSPDLTDDGFRQSMETLPAYAMLVMEDVDAMFDHCREASAKQKSSLSFSGFLNTLDGLAAPDNLITCLTTNHPEKLDPAVLRPGRIDMKIEFRAAGKEVASKYFKTFYKKSDLKTQAAAEKFGQFVGTLLGANRLSMAQLQHFFLQCHRLEKDAEAAANYVAEFRFDDKPAMNSAASSSNGMYC
ncbi:unnamed protein product [Amoebophrya sp. A25]|nr:unnamed protein product [Amoebophrya sp. A25]|eukprot:GSA25T00027009001.1